VGSKKKNRQLNHAATEPVAASGGQPWILIGGVLAFAAVTGLVLTVSSGDNTSSTLPESDLALTTPSNGEAAAAEPDQPTRLAPPPAPENRTPVPAADAVMPPLPLVPNMVPRAPEVIRDAYTFAAQRPDVLEYVPCFCGCETAGHKRNADCFVASRNTDGSVREWDTHGMACTICIDVARDAMQLRASGASTDDIRSAVDNKYAAYPRQTPTPAPPSN